MRPTHINIVGKSKFVFNHDVLPRLRDERHFRQLIQRIEPGPVLVLSDRVTSTSDVDPLISYLSRAGIAPADIRLRYPPMSPQELLDDRLKGGLKESGLTFGPDVAEHDDGLTRYFVSTHSFLAVQAHQRHLVIGPKGSGKSAILRALADAHRNSLVITPEHYATDVLDSLVKSHGSTELAAYITTWKYTLLIEIFRRVVQSAAGDTAAVTDLRRFLVDRGHLASNLSLFERFVGYLRRITQMKGKIGPAEAEIGLEGATELEKLFKMDELLELIPALRRALRRTPFTVFIDELDQSWNNSETANAFLVSLLTAAIQLRGIATNLHVVVFLRTEIFDLIKPTIAQLDKLRSDIEPIRWSSRELMNLILTRAFDSVHLDPEKMSAEAATTVLFPGIVQPSGVTTFEYLLSRTSYRPREVIQLCNLALRVADQVGLRAILPEAVLRAEEEFSTWKLEYVVSENLYIYPGLDLLLDRFRGRARLLAAHAIDSLLTTILLEAEEDPRMPEWLRAGLEPRTLLELLYRLEVIGIEKPNVMHTEGRLWDSYDYVFSRPKGKTEQSGTFLFHPGLWKALELV